MPLSNLEKAGRIARASIPNIPTFLHSHDIITLVILRELEAIDREEQEATHQASAWPQQEPGIDY